MKLILQYSELASKTYILKQGVVKVKFQVHFWGTGGRFACCLNPKRKGHGLVGWKSRALSTSD